MKPLIFNELKKYISQKTLRYDVPGHKGQNIQNNFTEYFGQEIIHSDVNSMPRLDNLNNSIGVIKESQQNIATIHQADNARFLINGTTSGIQAMIMATVKPNEKILIPQNVHKSIEGSLILSGAIPIYADVEFNDQLGIYTKLTLNEIKQKLKEYPEIKVVLLVNPSYYGICSEFEDIVKYLKINNKIVLVDEAHGGHFYYDEFGPKNAMEVGADVSCISYHKTLGSLTQTSLLVQQGSDVDIKQIDTILQLLNTTSPSYLFITNLECTIVDLVQQQKGKKLLAKSRQELSFYTQELNNIQGIKVLNHQFLNIEEIGYDQFKLVIILEQLNLTGMQVYQILRDDYNIQLELGEYNVCLAIITLYDDLKYLTKLKQAFQEISQKYYNPKISKKLNLIKKEEKSEINPRELFYQKIEYVKLTESIGKKCGASIMFYPPGLAIIRRGEIYNYDIINYIEKMNKNKLDVIGIDENKKVAIIKE